MKSFKINSFLQAGLLALTLSSTSALAAQAVVSRDALVDPIPALELPDAPVSQLPATASADPQNPAAKPDQTPAPPTPAASSSNPQQPTPSSPDDDAKKKHDEAERELKAEEKQRLLGIMPQFQVVMGGQAVALSAHQKWSLALHSAIDPFYIGWAFVVGGGIGELDDSHPGFGWGPAGYFKRVGATYADNLDGALIGNALLPAVLHQDPRYFRMGTGSIKRRFVHAALSTVICHGDNGKNQFNTSNVLGNFISGAVSNAYYPANERGVGLTLENGAQVTLVGALGGQLLEFGPDLARLVTRKHHKANSAPTPAPAPASTPTQAP